MELLDYLRLLRRRWYLIVGGCILGLLGAFLMTQQESKVYQSNVTFYLSDPSGKPVSTLLATAAQARIASYIELANTQQVAQAAVNAVKEPISYHKLQVTGSGVPSTIFMRLTVRSDTPAAAYLIAQSYAKVFPPYISRFERDRQQGSDDTTLSVLQQPSFDSTPISPDPKKNAIVGGLIGLVVGLAGTVLIESADSRLRSAEEAERIAGVPLLASVPAHDRGELLVADTQPRSPRSEALRQVRTNLQFAAIDDPLRSLIVTSALPSEGKSSTTANLAVTCARSGQRVVVVDADLRKPALADYFRISDTPGLTTALVGNCSVEDALVSWGDHGLCVLPSGPLPANPSELLGSEKMVKLLESLGERFDLILIDTPPLLPVTDAAVLATNCDGVLVVSRIGSTSRHRLTRAMETLGKLDVRVVGLVANFTKAVSEYNYYEGRRRGRRRNSRAEDTAAPPLRPAVGVRQAGSTEAGSGRKRSSRKVAEGPTTTPAAVRRLRSATRADEGASETETATSAVGTSAASWRRAKAEDEPVAGLSRDDG